MTKEVDQPKIIFKSTKVECPNYSILRFQATALKVVWYRKRAEIQINETEETVQNERKHICSMNI